MSRNALYWSTLCQFYVAGVFFLHICLCMTCILDPRKPEGYIRCIETEVADSCEAQSSCWESNASPLEEQAVRVTTESSFKSQNCSLHKIFRMTVS